MNRELADPPQPDHGKAGGSFSELSRTIFFIPKLSVLKKLGNWGPGFWGVF